MNNTSHEHHDADATPAAPDSNPKSCCAHQKFSAASASGDTKDPVCGMSLDSITAKFSTMHNDQAYFFCSAKCQAKFVAESEKYLSPTVAAVAPTSAGKQWTCPMHPQIVRAAPGACPICGMALESMAPSADDSHARAEIAAVRRKLWVAVALTTPVFLVAMVPHMTGWHGPAWTAWLEFVLGSIVVLWAGASFFQRFWASLRNRSPNMYTLIGLGVRLELAAIDGQQGLREQIQPTAQHHELPAAPPDRCTKVFCELQNVPSATLVGAMEAVYRVKEFPPSLARQRSIQVLTERI